VSQVDGPLLMIVLCKAYPPPLERVRPRLRSLVCFSTRMRQTDTHAARRATARCSGRMRTRTPLRVVASARMCLSRNIRLRRLPGSRPASRRSASAHSDTSADVPPPTEAQLRASPKQPFSLCQDSRLSSLLSQALASQAQRDLEGTSLFLIGMMGRRALR